MMRLVLLCLLALFFVLGVILGFQNAHLVGLSYGLGEIQLPLIALLVAEFLLAVLLTLLVVGGRVLQLKGDVRRLMRQLRRSEDELASLRGIPQETAAKTPAAPARHV